jgi:hypothetical protein
MKPAVRPTEDGNPFTREELEGSAPVLLHKGAWGMADLRLFRKEGAEWVVKDFLPCSPISRNTYGVWMVGRELAALNRLAGIPGFPQGAFRLDRFAFAYRFMPGREIGVSSQVLTPSFFEELESLVAQMHGRGVAHLDIRAAKNILISEGGHPFILDFQSHIPLEGLPRFLRNVLTDVDRSGVYKHWERRFPGTMGKERALLLERMNRRRKFWIFKG